MRLHMHTMRACCGAAIGAILASILLVTVYTPSSAASRRVQVTGRVTCGSRPLGGVWIFFQETGPSDHAVAYKLKTDGSFRIEPPDYAGLVPGAYRVYFFCGNEAGAPRPTIAPKYRDPRTSGLLVHVGPGWDDVSFTLPEAGRGATMAERRRVEAPIQPRGGEWRSG